MPNKALPWFKCWGGMTSDPKVAPLSDAVFRTWVELLDAASRQPHRGRFSSRKQAAAVVRRPLAHVAELVAERLIDETPDGLTMHDWDTWQRWRKEDAMDTGSTPDGPPDEPPNGHAMDSPSTTGSTQPLLRAQGAKTLDVRRKTYKTLDVRREYPPEAPPAAAEGAAHAEPVPTTKRAKRAAGERTPISAETLEELVVEYGEMFPGGTPAARLAADRAMNNRARLNALDERHYVQNWLRSDLERLKANGHTAPAVQDVPRQPPAPAEPCPECNRPIDARGDGHDQRRNLNRTPQEPDPLIPCRLFGQPPRAWPRQREHVA